MGCQNSTAKSADAKKKAVSRTKNNTAQKPAAKPKAGTPADDATHITVNPTPAVLSPAAPDPLEVESAKEKEEESEVAEEAVADGKATEAKVTEEKSAAEDVVVAVDPAEEPSAPTVVAEVAAVANPPADLMETAPASLAATVAPAAEPAVQAATAPVEEDDASPYGHRRHSTATPIHQESQTQRAADPNSPYIGPGPAEMFPIDSIYRCFEEENGLLFRLVSKKRHMWAFYNDTTQYVMRVSVTFGPESSVTALDDTAATAVNTETGECTLMLTVPPGETKRFMRGEYNGFTTSYDAEPVDSFEEKLEALADVPLTQPIEFAADKHDDVNDANANVTLDDNSDDGTRVHFMEFDPSKDEPEDDLKKRREEA